MGLVKVFSHSFINSDCVVDIETILMACRPPLKIPMCIAVNVKPFYMDFQIWKLTIN